MSLPKLKFRLPEWREGDFSEINMIKESLTKWQSTIGTTTSTYLKHKQQFDQCVSIKDIEGVKRLLSRRSAVRTLCSLWTDAEYRKKIPISPDLLETMRRECPRLGRLSLSNLTGVYFRHYDLLGEGSCTQSLGAFLSRCFDLYPTNKGCSGDLTRIANNRVILFASNAPVKVIQISQTNKESLDETLSEFGLRGYNDGRFREICATGYYLETLKKIPVGEDHEILSMVVNPDIYSTPLGSDGRLLGHAILEILIDRSDTISDLWRQVVTSIAGDPRIPEHSPGFQKWWQPIGEARIKKYKNWLSGIDLSVFLKIIAEYAESEGNNTLKRMFPSRRAFLEGLYQQGMVEASRLFLSKRAVTYLKKNYRPEELPEYAQINDANRSAIYLKINGYHFTEGSHSWKAWFFPYLPPESQILNTDIKEFHYRDLSTEIERAVEDEDKYEITTFTHNSRNFSWQVKIINYLRTIGLDPNLEQLFTPEDYKLFQIQRSDMC